MRMYQVDAFTDRLFTGNPAAVLVLQDWLCDDLMRAITQENNLAETAFVKSRPDGAWDLRWFTPACEVDFCGHATLATAHILFTKQGFDGELVFHTRVGELKVSKVVGGYRLDIPRLEPEVITSLPPEIADIFPTAPICIFRNFENFFVDLGSADGRCCKTLSAKDSHRESLRLDDGHEQAITRPLPHDELVKLHCIAAQTRVAADLAGQGDDLACAACSAGRPAVFSNAAIQFCLTIKVLFKLPLRQTTGMVASLLKMAGLDWAVPDYTTLCRRQKTLAVQISYRRADGPLNLLVDSTGIKFLGDCEWQARKHGVQGRRQWRKVHLAMDTATSDIRAVEFTSSSDGDSPVLPELLKQIPEDEDIGTVTADGAYDTHRCHTAIIDRQATAIIPIRKNGRPWKADCPAAIARNETLRATRHYGRAFWKRWTRYHVRSRIEAKMRCLKAFGDRISARDPDRQAAEIQIRIALMNRFSALGTAEIVRVT